MAIDTRDLKKRAKEQAQIGNYWAGKTLWLIDLVSEYEEANANLRCELEVARAYIEDLKTNVF